MREIKFRAWDQDQKRFGYIDLSSSDFGDPSWFDCPLQQYTGLKDKNGKEIYEGDIVKFSGSLAKHTTKVVYDAPEFMFEDVNSGARLSAARVSDIRISQFNPQQYEVIGNIYENPELIK